MLLFSYLSILLWLPLVLFALINGPLEEDEALDEFHLSYIITLPDTDRVSAIQKQGFITYNWTSGIQMVDVAAHMSRYRHRIKYKIPSSNNAKIGENINLFKWWPWPSKPKPLIPDAQDPTTLLNFAKMSANSYIARSLQDWRNLTSYDALDDFGWDGVGLRAHLFSNTDNSLLILAFKGTSTILTGGDTVANDKYNDNLMFSCCCARVGITWTPVCGCYVAGTSFKSCNSTCLQESITDPSIYYYQALALVEATKKKYPNSQLWFTGHSLGGALASLMTATRPTDTAAITFEAPGELLFAKRLGIFNSLAPASLHIYAYGLATDPIYTGTCTGFLSSCFLSGYALETKCRAGADCMEVRKGRRADVTTHRIDYLIDRVLKVEAYVPPKCAPVVDCIDCGGWKFI